MLHVHVASIWLLSFLRLAGASILNQEPLIGSVYDEGSAYNEAACHNACTELLNVMEDMVHYMMEEKEGFSESYQSSFQRDIVPACIVTPPNSLEVEQAIEILRSYPCPIAVKSGGHAPSAGMSNVEGGVTIDLKLLNQVEYLGPQDWDGTPSGKGQDSWEGHVTRVGPGNRWSRVYEVLEKHNVSVVGGRASTVGVGGFVLGGGISFLSHKNGWSADTVRNFEVVLPNGTLANVNYPSNPVLFKALRGGGSNFGIVTRFDMETFPQTDLWGGYRFYTCQPDDIAKRRQQLGIPATSAFSLDTLTNPYKLGAVVVTSISRITNYLGYNPAITSFLKAFEEVVMTQDKDHHSHLYWSFSYIQQVDTFLFGGQLVHTQGKQWPEVFEPYKKLRKPLWSKARHARLRALAEEEDWNDAGSRRVWMVTTVRSITASAQSAMSLHVLLDRQINIFIEELEKIKHVVGLIPSLTFQPITLNEIRNFRKNGGNALGIEESDGPLVALSLTIYYNSQPPLFKEDDQLIRQTAQSMVDRWEVIAKEHGMWHRYKYINYADGGTDVFAGYGTENREWLRKVKRDVIGNVMWDASGFKV